MGGRTRVKRSAAPAFWKIPRKRFKFVVSTFPASQAKSMSYPLAVFVRDVLKLVNNFREAKASIYEGKITIDGHVRNDPHYPVGLMDVVEIPSLKKTFRILPSRSSPLAAVEVTDDEKRLKLCKVRRKTTVNKGMIQYGFHDGRSAEFDGKQILKIDDSCLIQLPSQKLVKIARLEKGSQVIIVRGAKAGMVGTVKDVKEGGFSRPKMVRVSFEDGEAELPSALVFVVGREKPMISLGGGS